MREKLRIGIAGASGWMAGALAAAAEYERGTFGVRCRTGVKNEFSRVVALCDLDVELLNERKVALGLDGASLYTSYEEMLGSSDVDAVVIAVPNSLHAEFAIHALSAGKHVFLEKPYATEPEDSARLWAAAAASGRTTKIDYMMLHYDEQLNLKELLDSGALGELSSIHYTYRHPINVSESASQAWKLKKDRTGGALAMGTCHAIAATVFQAGSDPFEVICKSSPAKIRDFDYHTQHDMIISFRGGAVGVIQSNIDFAEKYDVRHTLIGTGGQFDYNPHNPVERRVMWSSSSLGRAYSPDADFALDHPDSGNVWENKCFETLRAFAENALKGAKDDLLGLESATARRVEAVIWAAEESAASGSKPVDAGKFLK